MPGEVVDVDVPLARDKRHATLHVLAHYAEDSQHARQKLQSGGTALLRRREDENPRWRRCYGIEFPTDDKGTRRTVENLEPGTYDLLVWGKSRYPDVGYRLGVTLQGGQEATIRVELRDGYGFRPSDRVERPASGRLRLRAQAEKVGALPWVVWREGVAVCEVDDQGFADITDGYLGPYPWSHVTLVEAGANGHSYTLQPAISPPK